MLSCVRTQRRRRRRASFVSQASKYDIIDPYPRPKSEEEQKKGVQHWGETSSLERLKAQLNVACHGALAASFSFAARSSRLRYETPASPAAASPRLSSPRDIYFAAAASPRLSPPRDVRAAKVRRRDFRRTPPASFPRNIHVVAAASPRPTSASRGRPRKPKNRRRGRGREHGSLEINIPPLRRGRRRRNYPRRVATRAAAAGRRLHGRGFRRRGEPGGNQTSSLCTAWSVLLNISAKVTDECLHRS